MIENINGTDYTVVSYGDNPTPLLGRRFVEHQSGALYFFLEAECLTHFATALPPLPRRPKPEDTKLLHRYMEEGLTPYLQAPKVSKWTHGYFTHIEDNCIYTKKVRFQGEYLTLYPEAEAEHNNIHEAKQ